MLSTLQRFTNQNKQIQYLKTERLKAKMQHQLTYLIEIELAYIECLIEQNQLIKAKELASKQVKNPTLSNQQKAKCYFLLFQLDLIKNKTTSSLQSYIQLINFNVPDALVIYYQHYAKAQLQALFLSYDKAIFHYQEALKSLFQKSNEIEWHKWQCLSQINEIQSKSTFANKNHSNKVIFSKNTIPSNFYYYHIQLNKALESHKILNIQDSYSTILNFCYDNQFYTKYIALVLAYSNYLQEHSLDRQLYLLVKDAYNKTKALECDSNYKIAHQWYLVNKKSYLPTDEIKITHQRISKS